MPRYSKPVRLHRPEPSEFFYVRVNENGRRTWRSTGAVTRKAAVEVVDTWRLRDAKGERHIEDLDFSAAVDQWLEAKTARVSEGCRVVYLTYIRHWKRYFKAKALRAVTAADLERYFRLRAQKVAARSLNNERATFSGFCRFARRRGWLRENPVEGVEKFREVRRAIRVLDEGQERRFLTEARAGGEDLYGFVLCLVSSGLRRGTVEQLEWRDIDWTAGEWTIPGAKMKSREDFTGRPVAPDLLAYLRPLRRPSGLVFGPLDAEKFQAAADRAGVPWLRPHDCRRSFVSRCRRLGIPMEVTMHLSDHRDLATVLRSYRSVDPAEVRAAMARLSERQETRHAEA
jgi:integrase